MNGNNKCPADSAATEQGKRRLTQAFYGDPDFVRATEDGIRAMNAGEEGIMLEELRANIRREISNQASDRP